MEIKYDYTKNYLKYYNEALGVHMKRKVLLKGKSNILPASTYFAIYIIIFLICTIIYLSLRNDVNIMLLDYIYLITVGIFICAIILIIYPIVKLNNHLKKTDFGKGTITFTEDGIEDKNSLGTIKLNWETINLIVISKHLINVITIGNNILMIENNKKNEVLKYIKKYSNAKIIDTIKS